ncbi:unnamed protein product [Oppiella nova]|uniref:Amidase domain-containing protein n=1 Tax=Oppiella nova TaxID=334625 RepID=A0A7R9M266_9ACAR|nr:unnamed protein product [Oppiella nova]CAG2169240.1 unnamed protein product [Oppiella nova]
MRQNLIQELHQLLGKDGILVFPAHPEEAVKHNSTLLKVWNVSYTQLFNTLNVAITSVPLGLSRTGLPIGLQIISSPLNDRLTIAVAEELERAFGGWDSDLVKLYGSLRTGGLFDVEVPYIGMDENACNKGYNKNKLDCPLEKGKTYKFTLVQTVPYSSRFNVFRYTTWRLVSSAYKDLTCAEFDIYQDIALNRYFSQFAERLN